MVESDDFYMILPSNSSPNTHPTNNASDYTVTWENAKNLDTKYQWGVAMTEMSYKYSSQCYIDNFSLRYSVPLIRKSLTDRFHIGLWYTTIGHRSLYQIFSKSGVDTDSFYHLQGQKQFSFSHIDNTWIFQSSSPFYLILPVSDNDEMVKSFEGGIKTPEGIEIESKYEGNVWVIKSKTEFLKKFEKMEPNKYFLNKVEIIWKEAFYEDHFVDIRPNRNIVDVEDLIGYLAANYTFIFEDIKIEGADRRKRIYFKTKPFIYELEFCNGLNFVLGLNRSVFSKKHLYNPLSKEGAEANLQMTGDYPPDLGCSDLTMFIYSSICQPISVGHILAPLLKYVPVDTSKVLVSPERRTYVARNPMYIPTSNISFNSIEINIRNDVGKLITFPNNSVTTIVLHFKKMYRL